MASVEIPLLEEIHTPSAKGLVIADYEGSKGSDAMTDLWHYARREIEL
jgi:chromosome partitioning protein